jgi:hypothetical protein
MARTIFIDVVFQSTQQHFDDTNSLLDRGIIQLFNGCCIEHNFAHEPESLLSTNYTLEINKHQYHRNSAKVLLKAYYNSPTCTCIYQAAAEV